MEEIDAEVVKTVRTEHASSTGHIKRLLREVRNWISFQRMSYIPLFEKPKSFLLSFFEDRINLVNIHIWWNV